MAIGDIVLGTALRSTLGSISRTQETIDIITERLATGLKVNTALDQPQNFFTARTLRNTASDQARLLDGIGQSIRTVQTALDGLDAIGQLVDQAETIATTSKEKLETGQVDPAVFSETIDSSPRSLHEQILSAVPDVYYQLNETGGAIVDSGSGAAGPVTAVRQAGASANAAALYVNGAQPSVNFDGINDRIAVSNSTLINTATTPARTVELVFNADDTIGRQVLYEEGGALNGITIYLDGGLVRVEAEDDQGANRFGNLDISAPVVAGQTYHVAIVFDGGADTVAGYLDGVIMGGAPTAITSDGVFPNHSGAIGIGRMRNAAQFHDGDSGGNGFAFNGRISNVAIYNRALSDTELLRHGTSLNASSFERFFNADYNNVIEQIDRLVVDANYRGINLLNGENLRTNFNSEQTSFLVTEGEDFSTNGLGLNRFDFNDLNDVDIILEELREARTQIREYGFTLTNSISVIETRNDFARERINTHEAGADDLTVADLNREGANLLATQTRQSLGVTALGLAAISQASTLRLFGTS